MIAQAKASKLKPLQVWYMFYALNFKVAAQYMQQ